MGAGADLVDVSPGQFTQGVQRRREKPHIYLRHVKRHKHEKNALLGMLVAGYACLFVDFISQ